jgi:glycerol-3-phosphate dehydrogenase
MKYDIVMIGAGIHGAAVAQAAGAAGYRSLVLEQYPQAATGSSSKSSKLIHGGLRYLESRQLHLVRECLAERKYLLGNAPHLVHMRHFHIPVYQDTRRRPWQIRLGLGLYALLGGKGFCQIPPDQWHQLDGLRTKGLDKVFRYHDAQTDDTRLTRAVLASAESLGADIRYRCTVKQVRCSATGCTVFYQADNTVKDVESRVLVNASGPWVNHVLACIQPAPVALPIDLVQGTHLVIPGKLQQGMYYLEAPQDQRAVFVTPWKDNILLGTTETLYTGDPARVEPLEEEIRYLLDVYNHYFEKTVENSQVTAAFAGLRVLPRSQDAAFHRSRDTLLHIDTKNCPRVLSIYGGKLTSHRATAEQVMRNLNGLLPARQKRADTRNLHLPVID